MKLLYTIFLLFGMVALTACCDCQINNWKWVPCISQDENTLKMEVSPYFTKNCEELVINGTWDNKLGKVHSMMVECEGSFGGVPVIKFSDPNACKFKLPTSNAPELFAMYDMLPTVCSKLEDKSFSAVIPYNEEDKLATIQGQGEFDDRILFYNINNVVRQPDCYKFSATLKCTREDEDY